MPKVKISRNLLYVLIFTCFVMTQWPVLTVANRIQPMLLGFPFLIGWVVIWWAIICVLFLVGYFTGWSA